MAEIDILSINNKKIQDVEARKDIQVIKENQINLLEDDTSMEGISDTVHDTLETDDKRIIGGINEVNAKLKDIAINVKDFGAKGDGITDDTPFIKKSIDYAISNNILNIKFPLGRYYIRELNITSSINFIFENSTLIRPLDTYSFLFDYHSDVKYNISQIGVSEDGVKQKISINDTSNFKRGDIIKIYSDDLIPNVRYNSKNGEFKVVYDVKDGYLLLSGLLRNSYTTNPGIVKLSDKTVNIKGITISAINNNMGESTLPAIQIVGGKYHNLNSIKVIDVSDTAIKMVGCYGYNADISSKYQANGETYNEDILKIGYGLIDIAGNSYRIKFNSNNCRHPFDTNQATTLADTYAEAHGVSENGSIVDSHSMGGSYAGISIHEDSYNINFNNINIIDSVRYGAVLRGESSIIQNCFIDCHDGITAGNYTGTTDKKTTNIGNHIVRSTKIKAKDVAISLNGLGTKAKISFYNCEIEGKINITDYDCEFYNCKLDIKDITSSNSSLIFNNCIITKNGGFSVLNSVIHFNSCKIYSIEADLIHPDNGTAIIEFNNCIIDWSTCDNTSRNSVFGLYSEKANAEISINSLNSIFISSGKANNLYIGYIGSKVKSCNVTLFNTFVYPLENLVFKKEPWDNNYVTVKNITYASGSKELT